MKKNVLLAIAMMLSANTFAQDKLDAYSRFMLDNLRTNADSVARAKTVSGNPGQETIRGFITVDSPKTYFRLRQLGVKMGFSHDNITTATIPLSSLDAVLAMADVKQMQIARPVSLRTDVVRYYCYVSEAHEGMNLEQPYKGKGVIFGTVDSGIDFQHAAFKDMDGKSRIKLVYLPNATRKQTGAIENYPVSIAGIDGTLDGYVYDANGLASLTTGTASEVHGTHTVSIAAGNPYGSELYYGMAPEADLILVDSSELRDADIIEGIALIFSEAQKSGQPAVINLSIGSNLGIHSEQEVFNVLLDHLTGPGRIITSASGNEADYKMWLNKGEGETVGSIITNSYGKESLDGILDIWGKDGKPYTVKIYARNPTDNTLVELYNSDEADEEKSVSVLKYTGMTSFNVYKSNVYDNENIAIVCNGTKMRNNYELVVEISGESEVDAWSANAMLEFNGAEGTDFRDGSPAGSYNSMACFENAISVGSYNSTPAFVWAGDGQTYAFPEDMFPVGEVSSFSSYGIDRDGRTQPTVIAPGAVVTAAYNYYSSASRLTKNPSDMISQYDEKDGRIQPYGVEMGTSMAAPCVAGIIALWLEQNPTLTPQDVKNIMSLTCFTDKYLEGQEARIGFGRINALRGLMLNTTDVVQQVADKETIIVPSAEGFSVLAPHTDKSALVEVYNAAGQQIMAETVSGNMTHAFSVTQRGMHVVKVTVDGKTTVKKVVL